MRELLNMTSRLLKPPKAKNNMRSPSFMAKKPPSNGIRIDGCEKMIHSSWTTLARLVVTSLIHPSLPQSPSINGKGFSWVLTTFKWARIWGKWRGGKETTSIWSIKHQMAAVNDWHAKISINIFAHCTYYLPFTKETFKHRFWDCIRARRTWKWVFRKKIELSGT